MPDAIVSTRVVRLRGRSILVHHGGEAHGTALLLIHGGWGGAMMHWSRVWDRLSERYRVIAPDLPGFGRCDAPALVTVRDYAEWLVALLDAVGVERAWCVGNSFGASVAWSLGGRSPDRCAGIVFVNGIPMPATPRPMLWAGRTALGAALMRAILRRYSYGPRSLEAAFVDPGHAPTEVRPMLAHRGGDLVARFAAVLIEGDGPPQPERAPLLLWGEGDKSPGTSIENARKLCASLPGATLRPIQGAGHFPQLEAPDAFVAELVSFVESR